MYLFYTVTLILLPLLWLSHSHSTPNQQHLFALLPNPINLTTRLFSVGGPSGCVCFASSSSAGAPAEGSAMAGWQPLPVCERRGCGASTAGHGLAALSQCPPSCAVQGRSCLSSSLRGTAFWSVKYLHLCFNNMKTSNSENRLPNSGNKTYECRFMESLCTTSFSTIV